MQGVDFVLEILEQGNSCISSIVLIGEVPLVAFPEAVSGLFTRAMVSAAGRAEHFEAQGTIVAVDAGKQTVTIDHREIKGLMSPEPVIMYTASG